MPDKKNKFALRIESKLQDLVKYHYPKDNCRSQNEFIEKAIYFYISYISSQDATEFLSHTLLPSIRGIVQDSENRVRQNLFKLATEVALNTRVISTYEGIEKLALSRMRGQVIYDLKRTNGGLHLEDSVSDKAWFAKLVEE